MSKAGFGLLFFLFIIVNNFAYAQQLPSKREVLEYMTLANNYFDHKYNLSTSGSSIKKDSVFHYNSSLYYDGLIAFYKIKPDSAYYKTAVRWGEKNGWKLKDGIVNRNAENLSWGQSYIDLYIIDKKSERINDIKASVDLMVSSPKIDDWQCVDDLQKAMPVFARLGALFNDKNYYEKMYQMYIYTKNTLGGNGLYNSKDNLWWRDKDFVAPYTEPNGKNCYWSRGNGLVVAALVNVIGAASKNMPHRDEYKQTLIKMLDAVKETQREDGFWNVSLHDPSYMSGPEFTGTALFTYGMAWAINNNLVSRKKYLSTVKKAWNAISKESVHPNGFLGYVQGTAKQPSDAYPIDYGRHPDYEDLGLGCFLLAGSEVFKLCE